MNEDAKDPNKEKLKRKWQNLENKKVKLKDGQNQKRHCLKLGQTVTKLKPRNCWQGVNLPHFHHSFVYTLSR